ncbi:efflux RND transporter periplasmic adaptor subunit [Pseudomonas gingeri]|uniref:Efflux RND transporter periplasmic adaptor subunit n=1 Tax=Pseudomonas gingeri TaxID=117681 RepID=A0A7Y7YAQ9_9PSED|nr:efflux RND transporter periplasmic adaptor subunit [Pseudomonas gingeri]NWB26547.1 efflux RND transporter periplasmic adaptor subunit [Pseudomonas gingeri]NWC32903.1 efflux RND transporter periplasmic adaptor subunit [Pseudomonas gingeri]NWD06922.1 efflux RND transporter periplasmic adaptor subunit [Pseudomonas gingeri]NWD48256.1 efflux RND transporter periplasmic adaptor subunit [Pseudomonas gingeri]NWE31520.1 efflux RND transporter periplasmic adaptor subunit [Pseudomonas gingeri]
MSTDTIVSNPGPRRRSSRGLVVLLLGLALLVAIVGFGIAVRATESRDLKTWTNTQALPNVNLVTPGVQPQGPVLNLPGRLEAYSRASIFARVNGYLKSWKVDIGSHVKSGQLLAEIDTPELDQQLLQARADLASAQANANLAETTAKRWQAMLASDSVSRQDVDERTSDLTAKLAKVKAAQANVEQLVATKGFQRLTAPFEGVVTARSTDVGALISAGGSAGRELFAVSDVSRLRVYVQVPQTFSPQIRVGTTARLTVPEYRQEAFTAKVIATADAVTAASGSTLVQLLVDNPGGRLLPGGYTSVQFDLPVQADVLRLPASALVFDDHGMRVATLDANNHVLFKTVSIARDFGDTVEIGSGLLASDRVIDTPPDGLADNDAVQVAYNPSNPSEAKPHG